MMIRITFITTSLSTGGAEAMLLKLLERIDRKKFEPYVISLASNAEIGQRIERLEIPVTALDISSSAVSLFSVLRLVNLLRKISPDVVQTWMYHADLLGGVAARLAGVKRIVWALRNSNLSRSLNKRSTLNVVKICAAISPWIPKYILSCSKRSAELHAALGYSRNKIKFIANGFNVSEFRPSAKAKLSVRQELRLSSDALLVGLIARYDSQKNHVGFIHAAAQISRAIPNVHFVLAGMNVDANNAALKALIDGHGLTKYVHLLGRRDDIARLMASLDVLTSSSYGEAFPNVLGEAMACGVPCVVTDVGDSAEIVGETGRVVQSGDMKGLAQNIQELLSLPIEERVQLGGRARMRVAANYEIGCVTRLYEQFYERMVGGNYPCVE